MALSEGKAILEAIGQDWLLEGEADGGEKICEQAVLLNEQYPGGLAAYVGNAKRLLKDSAEGVNPFEGFVPEVPEGLVLEYGSEEFKKYESIGMDEIKHTGFILVAGGLGERLGYGGIKLELPVEVTTDTCYLEYYIQCLDALQREAGSDKPIPLAIMTSGDTHDKTKELLEKHSYFSRDPETITLMKQEKIPSICDNTGRFVKEAEGVIETKPHGHGDVHQLMHSTGTAKKWGAEGVKWVFFIQDTNAMVFNTTQGALGLSKERGLQVNSICIARKPQEAIGGIARLVSPGKTMTVNVEYNQLDPLLRAYDRMQGRPEQGDVANETGFSPYPGNINTLVFHLPPYLEMLEVTEGLMPEFVNPKYKDSTKTSFAKPTRLECMMQDYPKLLSADAAVGFTTFDRLYAFSPVKNNTKDAAAKEKAGLDANCASSAEADFYKMQCSKLSLCGVEVEEASSSIGYEGINIAWPPRVVLHPSFAPTHAALCSKIGGNNKISSRSTLIVQGRDIHIANLDLDGALRIKAVDGAKVVIKSLKIRNKGFAMKPAEAGAPEAYTIRGYSLDKQEVEDLVFDTPGEYTIEK
eukprot:TRINITY_DN16608_c0_g1_i1.p1 TRINITY_DN16608_c0_g1~~TRINITY_DN16608_c0_g1_i1.p1  ORF type:complete len:596 (+),score=160.96 TRINITY_DN16608_c0_g1_i1:48-1790(+)